MNGTRSQCLAPREHCISLALMPRTRTVSIAVTAEKDTEILPAGVIAGRDGVILSSTPSILRCL